MRHETAPEGAANLLIPVRFRMERPLESQGLAATGVRCRRGHQLGNPRPQTVHKNDDTIPWAHWANGSCQSRNRNRVCAPGLFELLS